MIRKTRRPAPDPETRWMLQLLLKYAQHSNGEFEAWVFERTQWQSLGVFAANANGTLDCVRNRLDTDFPVAIGAVKLMSDDVAGKVCDVKIGLDSIATARMLGERRGCRLIVTEQPSVRKNASQPLTKVVETVKGNDLSLQTPLPSSNSKSIPRQEVADEEMRFTRSVERLVREVLSARTRKTIGAALERCRTMLGVEHLLMFRAEAKRESELQVLDVQSRNADPSAIERIQTIVASVTYGPDGFDPRTIHASTIEDEHCGTLDVVVGAQQNGSRVILVSAGGVRAVVDPLGEVSGVGCDRTKDLLSIMVPVVASQFEKLAAAETFVCPIDEIERVLAATIEAKDAYTRGHCERVAEYAKQLAKRVGLSEPEITWLESAGRLHDIGKVGVDDRLICKQASLSKSEFAKVREHAELGWAILCQAPSLAPILPGILHHHERYDGKGYPDGLAGEAIPIAARIIAIADSFDAMTTTRSYRDAMPPTRALEILDAGAGTQWDPILVRAFVEMMRPANPPSRNLASHVGHRSTQPSRPATQRANKLRNF